MNTKQSFPRGAGNAKSEAAKIVIAAASLVVTLGGALAFMGSEPAATFEPVVVFAPTPTPMASATAVTQIASTELVAAAAADSAAQSAVVAPTDVPTAVPTAVATATAEPTATAQPVVVARTRTSQ